MHTNFHRISLISGSMVQTHYHTITVTIKNEENVNTISITYITAT